MEMKENGNKAKWYLVYNYTWDTKEKIDTSGKEWGVSRGGYRTRKETREEEIILSAKTEAEALLEKEEVIKKLKLPESSGPHVVYKYNPEESPEDSVGEGEVFTKHGRRFVKLGKLDL